MWGSVQAEAVSTCHARGMQPPHLGVHKHDGLAIERVHGDGIHERIHLLAKLHLRLWRERKGSRRR